MFEYLYIAILQYHIINIKIMGLRKTDLFTKTQNVVADLAKSMSHPARIAILDHLLKVKVCNANAFVTIMPLAQPTVSQHLKEMSESGILKTRIEGSQKFYQIDEKVMAKLLAYLVSVLS